MDSRYDSKKGRFVMKKNTGERPLITGQLKVGSQTFNIVAYSWVSFLFEINQMIRETEIQFPLGEDEQIRMVKRKIQNVERFK